ncbi:hypothetical protein MTP99_016464 [Tenebrio molitor]|nr:hypothetical protein MTP99_016464 [Tenebrio molitor]
MRVYFDPPRPFWRKTCIRPQSGAGNTPGADKFRRTGPPLISTRFGGSKVSPEKRRTDDREVGQERRTGPLGFGGRPKTPPPISNRRRDFVGPPIDDAALR